MNKTIPDNVDTYQDMYEWWRSKKEEISNSIEELRESDSTKIDDDILDFMESFLKKTKIRRSFIEYYDEEV